MDRADTGRMKTITQLELMKVVTEDGEMLGHVFDLRSPGRTESRKARKERPIGEILYGRRGLLEMLGFVEAKLDRIPWDAVVGMNEQEIIVSRKPSR
jgi:hypothetical protein